MDYEIKLNKEALNEARIKPYPTEKVINLGINRGLENPVIVTTSSMLKYVTAANNVKLALKTKASLGVKPLLNPTKIKHLLKRNSEITVEELEHMSVEPLRYTQLEKRVISPKEIRQLKARVFSRCHEARKVLRNLINITLEDYTLFEVVRMRLIHNHMDQYTKMLIQIVPANNWVNYLGRKCEDFILLVNLYRTTGSSFHAAWATKRSDKLVSVDGVPLFTKKIIKHPYC